MPRFAQFALFLGTAIVILGGIHYYLWARLIHATALPPPWGRLATLTLIVLALTLPLTFLLSRLLGPGAKPFLLVPYVWMGTMFLCFTALVATDLLRGVLYLGLWVSGHGGLIDHVRRVLVQRLVAGGVVAVVLVSVVVAVHTALGAPTVVRVRVELAGLPAELDGFTLVQLTDLHLGPTLGGPWLRGVVATVNGLAPDAVVITGDLVDGSVERLRPHVAPLTELAAPGGTFFVTGNHEFYAGVDEWLPELGRLGVRVLDNERVALGRGGATFDLAGIHDGAGRGMHSRYRPDLPRALAGRDPARALVLLSHQPRTIRAAAAAGVGLQLSGHTHGGQIWPWRYLVYLQQPFVRGLHRVGGAMLYVSDGTGFWGPPMRLGTRAEITHVTLMRAR